MQKVMYKGLMKDEQTLREAKVVANCKVILIGSTLDDIIAAENKPSKDQLKAEEEKGG